MRCGDAGSTGSRRQWEETIRVVALGRRDTRRGHSMPPSLGKDREGRGYRRTAASGSGDDRAHASMAAAAVAAASAASFSFLRPYSPLSTPSPAALRLSSMV